MRSEKYLLLIVTWQPVLLLVRALQGDDGLYTIFLCVEVEDKVERQENVRIDNCFEKLNSKLEELGREEEKKSDSLQ